MGTNQVVQTLLLLVQLSMLTTTISTSRLTGFRMHLTHIDSHSNYTKLELLQRATRRSHHRMSRLIATTSSSSSSSSSKAILASSPAASESVQSSIHAGNGEFLMDVAIGSPSLSYSAIVDTGSDLIWTQCKPCVDCYSQPTQVFDPTKSSTYAKIQCTATLCEALPSYTCTKSSDCDYTYSYGDSSSTQGVLATETFEFGKTKIPNIAFGCGDTNVGDGFSQGAGLVGLGRGPLSLISQLDLGKFSYCLTSLDDTTKSPLLFGSLADFSSAAASSTQVQTTPLVKNPNQPSFYYLNLVGITVGGKMLSIPKSTFALQDDGTGGVIIDSGTSITYLEVEGYKLLKKSFASQMQMPVADGSGVGLDLCFSPPSTATSIEVPKLVLHFDGADLDLPAENYIVADSSSGLLCLTVMGSRGLSIIGNFQQQNYQFLYDLGEGTLSFVPVQCNQL